MRILRSAVRSTRTLVAGALVTVVVLSVLAVPAGAQQLVDAGGPTGSGAAAFLLFVVVVLGMAGALFFMDRVRRNRIPEDERPD